MYDVYASDVLKHNMFSKTRIYVHVTFDMFSRNAAERCGLFSAVYLLLKQVTCEGQVSVINTVKKVRAARPLALKCQVTPHIHKYQYWICIF